MQKLVYRRIAGNTNERTCIAATLPEKSCANDGLPVIQESVAALDSISTVLNSFCFDYALRFRVMTHVDYTHISRVALPPLDTARHIHTLTTTSCHAVDPRPLRERPEMFESSWKAERSVAQAYGLAADDFAHILTTFPVFARKRPAFFAYLQQRVTEWRAEQ